jgi:hypothetical protein
MRRDVFLQGGGRGKLGMVMLLGLSFLAGRLERRPARPAASSPADPSDALPTLRPSAAAESELRLELIEARLARLEQLGARLANLEQRQLEVADNLCDANSAFRQWRGGLDARRGQVQKLGARLESQPTDQLLAPVADQSPAGEQLPAEAGRAAS